MNVIVKQGQTLADIAIQELGAIEALPDLARMNSLPMSYVPPAGTMLQLPEKTYNLTMEDYCKAHDVSPSTAWDEDDYLLRIFTYQFQTPFE